MKRIISLLVTVVMVGTLSTTVFAEDDFEDFTDIESVEQNIICEDAIDSLEEITGTDCIEEEYDTIDGDYVFVDEENEFVVPEDAEDGIGVSYDGNDFSFDLPEEIDLEDRTKSDNGTITYESDDDYLCSIQVVSQNNSSPFVRSIVSILDKDCSKKYTYHVNLDKNMRLVYPIDYYGESTEYDNSIFIVDDQNMIISIIDAPWAKDGNGESIATHYEINGECLIQYVDFDENSVFPITADPQFYGCYYKVSNVKKDQIWSSWKKVSGNILGGKYGGTLTVGKGYSISGSISGNAIYASIGVGKAVSCNASYSWKVPKNKRAYAQCKTKLKRERGTCTTYCNVTRKKISSSNYTVTQPMGKTYNTYRCVYY